MLHRHLPPHPNLLTLLGPRRPLSCRLPSHTLPTRLPAMARQAGTGRRCQRVPEEAQGYQVEQTPNMSRKTFYLAVSCLPRMLQGFEEFLLKSRLLSYVIL